MCLIFLLKNTNTLHLYSFDKKNKYPLQTRLCVDSYKGLCNNCQEGWAEKWASNGKLLCRVPVCKSRISSAPPPPPLDLLIIFTNPSPPHTKYNVTVEVEKLENHLRYLLSDNPACAGRFLREEYKPIKAQWWRQYKAMHRRGRRITS